MKRTFSVRVTIVTSARDEENVRVVHQKLIKENASPIIRRLLGRGDGYVVLASDLDVMASNGSNGK